MLKKRDLRYWKYKKVKNNVMMMKSLKKMNKMKHCEEVNTWKNGNNEKGATTENIEINEHFGNVRNETMLNVLQIVKNWSNWKWCFYSSFTIINNYILSTIFYFQFCQNQNIIFVNFTVTNIAIKIFLRYRELYIKENISNN